jgi:hypothetical protein
MTLREQYEKLNKTPSIKSWPTEMLLHARQFLKTGKVMTFLDSIEKELERRKKSLEEGK